MKNLLSFFIIFLLATIAVSGQSKTRFSLKDFKKIPVQYLQYDSLPKYIHPDKNYTYWEYDDGQMDTTKPGRLLFSTGTKPPGLVLKDPRGYMLAGCLPAFCYKYIAYVYNGKVGYITNNNDLIAFMGKIDNLAEAMLLANLTDNVFPDANKQGGAYRITPNGYEVIMTKYELCPGSKQAIQYNFDGKGITKKIKRKVYDRSGGCAVI